MINSNWNLYKDLTGFMSVDDYYLIVITDVSQINTLISGEYYTSYSMWLNGWEDKGTLWKSDIVGRDGLSLDVYFYYISDNNRTLYSTYYFDDDFQEAKNFVNKVKNMKDVQIDQDYIGWISISCGDIEITGMCSLFYNGQPLITNGYSGYDICWSDNIYIYDVYNHLLDPRYPGNIRNKETQEYVDVFEFVERVDQLYNVEDKIDEAKELVSKYEYYWEEKYHVLNFGKPIM